MKKYYVYRLEHLETKEFYWGSRGCNCDPKDDPYMGSMKRWKPDKTKLIKTTIIEYETREQATKAEDIIIRFYIDKTKFPLNRNYAFACGCFGVTREGKDNTFFGKKHTDETRMRMRLKRIGKDPWNKGLRYKILSEEVLNERIEKHKEYMCSEEHKEKVSNAHKGKRKPSNNFKWSEERKKKYSNNFKWSEERKKKPGNRKGQKMSEEAKQKMRETRLKKSFQL